MKTILFASAVASICLLASQAGAAGSDVIRTFEKDGKISFLISNNGGAPAPANLILPAAAGKPHGCNNYPGVSTGMHETGTVMLSMDISPEGNIENLALAEPSLHARLNNASLACVKTWAYSPALRNGQPVAVQHTVEIVWYLNN